MNIVWFKKDLRIEDNEALVQASRQGISIMPLYILEPELWHQPDMSHRHYIFLQDCIVELNQSLSMLGQRLIIKVGNAVDILNDIHQKHCVRALWSHQETGNYWTYKRDQAVKKWCSSNNILWHEPRQNGVIRGLKNRNGWAKLWDRQMTKKPFEPPFFLNLVDEESDRFPSPAEINLKTSDISQQQIGGHSQGIKLLNSFLYERGENYTKEMSSPVSAFESCSRISAHLTFGTLSLREVFQACERRHKEINLMPKSHQGQWARALRSFSGRLHWHCHFIQKLEDEPRIEFKNMHAMYDGLRENNFNQDYFRAWKVGKTGYPMVDACIRALIATGWINFRMRAMLMSFASYHLWLHWRKPALHLAKLFTDYEPGIHYSQVQMQSGTTGINAIRIYNPIKQSIDQDPNGVFIRQWIPELRHIDQAFIHTPWMAPSKISDYPIPIVDEKAARKTAADKIYSVRKDKEIYTKLSQKIIHKHGSRKTGLPSTLNKRIHNQVQKKLFE